MTIFGLITTCCQSSVLSVIVLTPICSTFFEKRVGLVTDPVIQAIGRPEFEDGLRMGVQAPVASALNPWSMLEPL